MIYTNPRMHTQYREHGKNDFVCTNAVTYYKKGELLHAVVQMRSNDAIFGYINDLFWQQTVLRRLCDDLSLVSGQIVWQAQSLHIYPRHFHLIDLPIEAPIDYELEDMGAYEIGAYDE
jgi:thymidylate synthase